MANFDVSKEWVILFPSGLKEAQKAAEDLSRYIGLLADLSGCRAAKAPAIVDASANAPPEKTAIIALNSDDGGCERNGFTWRAGSERVEIYGESGRGLCNGVYSFLAALGIGWPIPGKENLPSPAPKTPNLILLSDSGAYEPSGYEGMNSAAAPWRRYLPGGKKAVRDILKNSGEFVEWAARRRYDAVIFPLAAFTAGSVNEKIREFKKIAGEYGITVEAGGRELSSLVPRQGFLFHRDFFRMEGGRRKKAHHFCPTNPGAIKLAGREALKFFRAAEFIKVFHLWPDMGAETSWCSCPTCRAFSPLEQNRIAVNTAADILAKIKPDACLTYFEKAGESGTIPLRQNLFKLEKLPEEKITEQ